MSTQEMVRLRFPSGSYEISYGGEEPKVGDRLARGETEWEVIAVEKDADGNAVVTLGPAGDGKANPPARREE